MNSINPDHVVKYQLNVDTSISSSDEYQNKLKAIEQAKIIYFLYNHDPKSTHFKTQCIFFQKIIEQIYDSNTVILVEESAASKKFELHLNWFVRLNRSKYQIEGWDDPEVYQKTFALFALIDKVTSATKNVIGSNQSEKSQIDHWNTLKNFAATQSISFYSDSEIDSYINKKMQNVKQKIFEERFKEYNLRFKIAFQQLEIDLMYSTFENRQNFLNTQIEKKMNEGRKVIILCGKSHGNPKDAKFIPIVQNHFSKIKEPYIIVEPSIESFTV